MITFKVYEQFQILFPWAICLGKDSAVCRLVLFTMLAFTQAEKIKPLPCVILELRIEDDMEPHRLQQLQQLGKVKPIVPLLSVP